MTPPRVLLAIDPGDIHVGVACFEGSRAVWAKEYNPRQFLNELAGAWLAGDTARGGLTLVVEEWRLFPQHAPRAIGSDMPTSRLIGAISALARYLPGVPTPVVLQSPQIKIPTRAMLRSRGLASVAKLLKVSGDHAQDAELHGYYYLRQHQCPWPSVEQQRANWPHSIPSSALW